MPKLNPVSWKVLQCVFEKDGFAHVRTEGDHLIFTRTGVLRPVVIPKYQNIPVFIIKNYLLPNYFTSFVSSNSTSKTSVAFGGITGG